MADGGGVAGRDGVREAGCEPRSDGWWGWCGGGRLCEAVGIGAPTEGEMGTGRREDGVGELRRRRWTVARSPPPGERVRGGSAGARVSERGR